LLLVATGVGLHAPSAAAAAPNTVCTDSWINGFGGDFADPTSWSSGQVPGPTDVACINLPGTYNVVVTDKETVGRLLMTAHSGAQTLQIVAGQQPTPTTASLTTALPAGRSFIGSHAAVQVSGTIHHPGTFATTGPLDNKGEIGAGNYGHLAARGAEWTNEGDMGTYTYGSFQGGHRLVNRGTITGSKWFNVTGQGTRLVQESGTIDTVASMGDDTYFVQGDGSTHEVRTAGHVRFTGTGPAHVIAGPGATVSGNTVSGQAIDAWGSPSKPVTWQAPATIGGDLGLGSLTILDDGSGTAPLTITPSGTVTGDGGTVMGNLVNEGTAVLYNIFGGGTLRNDGAMQLKALTVTKGARFVNGKSGSVTGGATVAGTWVQGPNPTPSDVEMMGTSSVLDLRGGGDGYFTFRSGGKIIGNISAGQHVALFSDGVDNVVRTPAALTNDGSIQFGLSSDDAVFNIGGTGVFTNRGQVTATGPHASRVGVATGSLTNSGSVTATGGVTVDAGEGFSQTATGSLSLQVSGGVSSSVQTTGPASVAGGLSLDTVSPDSTGTPLTLVSAQAVSGTFDSVTSPGATYALTYGPTTVTATPQ
jgi:hypothetical protein